MPPSINRRKGALRLIDGTNRLADFRGSRQVYRLLHSICVREQSPVHPVAGSMPIASKGTTMIMHLTQDRDLREQLREVFHRSFLAVVAVMCIACLVSLKPGDAEGAEVDPTEVIKGTVTELFSILKEFQGPGRSQARRLAIEQVIRRDVHYEDMAKRSLGVSWAQMDDGARTVYVDLFVHLLRDALANRMTQYAGERIMYLAERRMATCAEVKTRLVGSKVDTTLDFRLIRTGDRWLVYDAILDGASLVGSYRAQFASIIRDGSLGELMEKLQEKTLLVKLFETHGS